MNHRRSFFEVEEPAEGRVVAVPGGDVLVLLWDLADYADYTQAEQPGHEVLQALGVDPAHVHRPPTLTQFGRDGVLRPPRPYDGSNERRRQR